MILLLNVKNMNKDIDMTQVKQIQITSTQRDYSLDVIKIPSRG